MSLDVTITDVLKWGSNMGSAVINVTNTSDVPVQNWSVEIYVNNSQIFFMDSMIVKQQSDIQPFRFMISGKPWNCNLDPCQSIRSGFNFTGDTFTWYKQ
jgi:hypothetical protein